MFQYGFTFSHLFQGDDPLSLVTVSRDGKHGRPFLVGDLVLHLCVDSQVFVIGFDFSHSFPNLSRLRDVELVVFWSRKQEFDVQTEP